MLTKNMLIVTGYIFLSGCGSISTLSGDESNLRSKLVQHKTRCDTISRIYSGVSYDICRLNSVDDGVAADLYGGIFLTAFLLDMAPSFVVDTLALPYTGYKKYQVGDMAIRSEGAD